MFPWARRKQKLHSFLEFMPKLSKFISKFIYSSKRAAGGIDCILTERQKKFHRTLQSFPLKVRKNQVFRFFMKRIFFKKVLWTRESSFHNHAIFLPNVRKSLDKLKNQKKTSPKFTISWKNAFGGLTYILDSFLQKLFPRNQKTLHLKSENLYKKIIYWSNFHLDKKMEFCKSCQKIKPIVSWSSALGLQSFKKFWFLYLKTVSSFNGRLVT